MTLAFREEAEECLALSEAEATWLSVRETAIAGGLETFVQVGQALSEIRNDPRKVYRPYGTFEDYCRDRWGLRQSHAYRMMEAAHVVTNLKSSPIGELLPAGNAPVLPANEAQARPLVALKEPAQQREAWKQVLRETGGENITAARVEKAVKVLMGETTNVHVSDDSYEWYTPLEYLDATRALLGEIDLDPATHPAAQEKVRAVSFYTKAEDGLAQPWQGRVFLNPPYSGELVEAFTARVVAEVEAGRVSAAVVLVNNATDTAWFQALLSRYPVCFPAGRLRFWKADGGELQARQGQAVFGLGVSLSEFAAVFGRFGTVLFPVPKDHVH